MGATAPPLTRDSNRFRVGEVSYNGVRFPPAIHSNASFEPILDDSGRVLKYVKMKLNIEAYIFPGCFEESSWPDGTGTIDDALDYNAPTSVEDITEGRTTDVNLAVIKLRLTEPCQRLSFTDQGAGIIVINNTPGLPSVMGLSVPGPQDVDNGPKPKMIDWKPLTNKMALVKWEVETCFAPCANVLGGTASDLAQFPFSVLLTLNNKGLSTRVITGQIETSLTRISSGSSPFALESKPFDMRAMETRVIEFFPLLKQFRRTTQEFTLSNDRKHLHFSIIDEEIDSDEAFGRGIADEKVALETSASLVPGGFRRWNVILRGRIEVLPGYTKSFAYLEMAKLFNRYYMDIARSGKTADAFTVTAINESGLNAAATKGRSYPILQSIKYNDDLFGRSVDFAYTWLLFTDMKTLFQSTGLFQFIDPSPGGRFRRWDEWVFDQSRVLDTAGYQKMDFTNKHDIIVGLCTPFMGPKSKKFVDVKQTYEKPPREAKEKDTFETPRYEGTPDTMYGAYHSTFHIVAEENTLTHYPLDACVPTTERPRLYPNSSNDYTNDITLQSLAGSPGEAGEVSGPQKVPVHHKIRKANYTLVFSGAAIRLARPVDVPMVFGYGDRQVVKVGTDIIKPYVLGAGVDAGTGKTYQIHGLVWRKHYSLPNTPFGRSIVTDGHPAQYTT